MTIQTSRRGFLKGAAAAGAVLAIGVDIRGAAAAASPSANLTPFVTVGADGAVTVISKHFEGGSGAATGLAALVAEEMNMKLSDIGVVFAPSNPAVYGNLFFKGFQATGGSTAIANSFMQYRTAGAAAKEMLIAAAALAWGVDGAGLTLKDRVISGGGKSGGIGEFVAAAATLPVPEQPKLKDPSEWTVFGKDIKARRDTAQKINGTAQFSMDVQLENQMVCAIARAPRMGATVAGVNDSAAREVKGFIMAIALPNEAGVVAYAENTWAAFRARDALQIEWDFSQAEARSSDRIREELIAMVNTAPAYNASKTEKAASDAAIAGAAKVVEETFYFPLLAHATMEPMGATIEPTVDGGVIMHDGAQAPTGNHMVMHQILELPMEKIQVNTLFAGGYFGRRGNATSDYLVELTLAFAVTDRTRPVKLVWSREDDIRGGLYRPQVAHKVRIGLDSDGRIVGWDHRVAAPSIMKGTMLEDFSVHDGVDHSSVEGIADGAYSIPHLFVGLTDLKKATTLNWWRSVGHSHTGYVMEVMMDRAAAAAGIDPVTFRLQYLSGDSADNKRMAAVVRLAAEKGGWDTALPEDRARGFAAHKSFGSYVAEVCEISRDADGVVKIEKVTAAVDCGIAVTPDVIRAQIESGIGYGIGHVMRDEITLEGGEVVQSNFPDYEPLRMRDIGAINVHIVPSTEHPTGVGEPGTPPAGPALANAIAAAGGPVITALPMIVNGVDFA